MNSAITPLTNFPPTMVKITRGVARKGAFNFDWLINSTMRIPVSPPKKKPAHVPGPQNNGVRMTAPVIEPIADARKDFFASIGFKPPDMFSRKSIISAIIEAINRNKIICHPIRSKPVKIA